MIKIAIIPEFEIPNEIDYIISILDAGWDYVHLRRPQATIADMKRLIETIPQHLHCRLKLHGHFNLINDFNLGGLHLNHRCPTAPSGYNGKISQSCHSIKETLNKSNCEYVTLSPIFDSISKTGYTSAFTPEELKTVSTGNVIALGGINAERIDELKRYPFAGFAMLGYLFNSKNLSELKIKLDLINSKI